MADDSTTPSTGAQPIITKNEDGSLPQGLGEPIDTAAVKIAAHSGTTFDEKYFLELLSGSVSLNKVEKLRIIESIPRLSQAQIDRLIQIFQEEKEKISALDSKHPQAVSELELQKKMEWKDLEEQAKEQSQRENEVSQLDLLKSKLQK